MACAFYYDIKQILNIPRLTLEDLRGIERLNLQKLGLSVKLSSAVAIFHSNFELFQSHNATVDFRKHYHVGSGRVHTEIMHIGARGPAHAFFRAFQCNISRKKQIRFLLLLFFLFLEIRIGGDSVQSSGSGFEKTWLQFLIVNMSVSPQFLRISLNICYIPHMITNRTLETLG